MDLKKWYQTNKEIDVRKELAARCGTTSIYLRQLAYDKGKKTGPILCKKLYFATLELTPKQVILPSSERPDIDAIFQLGKEVDTTEEANQ